MPTAGSSGEVRSSFVASVPRMLAFILLLAVAAILECARLTSLHDLEIWEHLRVGSWILEHHSLPRSGLFSQASALPWRDFTWGYDFIVALAYRIAGLYALPALLILFRVALASVTFLLAGGWRNFWAAASLSAIAQYTLFSMGPTAHFVSLLFLGLELLFLLEIRQSGNSWRLVALPVLFFSWANLEIGFVYGIVLYAAFFVAVLLDKWDKSRNFHWLSHPEANISTQAVALTGGACVIASFLTPSSFHAYGAFFASEISPVNANLSAYSAMGFRQPQDYVLMLLAMAAFLSLGLLRSRDIFQICLLCGCTALAFHARGENWMLALVSVAVIGRAIVLRNEEVDVGLLPRGNGQRLALPAFALLLVFVAFAIRVPRSQSVLLAKVAEALPVRAADFLRQHPTSPPLFNSYQWGNFLTWYLPEYPVAIDDRRGLYPEEHELDYFKVMNADIQYKDYPPLDRARTVLLPKVEVMGEAFRGVPGFQVVYEDDISIVYSHDVKE